MDRTSSRVPPTAVRSWCLALATLLVLPALVPGAAVAAAADELEDEDLSPQGDFLAGFGNARGTGVRVGPSRSGFNFTTDFAVSLADYQNTVARADSRGLSLGMIIETGLETFDEEGDTIPLPEALRIDSRDDGAADGMSAEVAGFEEAGFGGAVGSQYVRADEDPFSEVETVMATAGLGPLLSLGTAKSHATAGIVADGQREARGQAIFGELELLEGAIVLEGREWTAIHRSGVEEEADATFTLGDIKIMGESVLPDEASEAGADALSEAIDAVNQLTNEVGLNLEVPEKVVNEETGQVAMTPLKVAIAPSDVSQELLRSPLGDAIQTIREPLADALIDANELFGAAFLLFDVIVGAFAGGGELLVEIGGARAVTGAQEFDDPFGAADGFGEDFGELPDETVPESAEGPDLGGEPESSAQLGAPPSTGGGSDGPSSSTTPDPQTSTAPETVDGEPDDGVDEPVASQPPEQAAEGQQAAQQAASPGSRGGPALLAALVALLVAAGLGGADFLRLRQSQRTILG